MAASDSSSSPTSVVAAFPRVIFPTTRSYAHWQNDADKCATHLWAHAEELRAALKTLDPLNISTEAYYSDARITHIIYTLLEGDAERHGWRRIYDRPRKQRDEALRRTARQS